MIEIVNIGVRRGPPEVVASLAAGEDVDPRAYYMRTAARLETGHPGYAWVNYTLFVCSGARRASSLEVAFYKVV